MSEETATYQVTKSTPNLNTMAGVVSDILGNLTVERRAEIANTLEDDLIQFHPSWGRDIRDRYNLWQDSAVLHGIGEDHPDDASMVIIRKVWQQLQNSEETD